MWGRRGEKTVREESVGRGRWGRGREDGEGREKRGRKTLLREKGGDMEATRKWRIRGWEKKTIERGEEGGKKTKADVGRKGRGVRKKTAGGNRPGEDGEEGEGRRGSGGKTLLGE